MVAHEQFLLTQTKGSNMQFEAGKVYHQQFENGDREYFLAIEQFKNPA
jgi:hypothetical protein